MSMLQFFITFVVFADSLLDADLLRTVASVRLQEEMCWHLEVRVPYLPNDDDLDSFTHCNQRISVTSVSSNESIANFESAAFTILPKGIVLRPNFCTEIKKAFESPSTNVIAVNIIFGLKTTELAASQPPKILPLITVIQRRYSQDNPRWLREIITPLGTMHAMPEQQINVPLPETFSQSKDARIRVEYFAQQESEIAILREQLRSVEERFPALEVEASRFRKAQALLVERESELALIKKSRTWKVGRVALGPARLLRRWLR